MTQREAFEAWARDCAFIEPWAAWQASAARYEGVVAWVGEYAAEPCDYGDNCPANSGSRHYTCRNCQARSLLAALDGAHA